MDRQTFARPSRTGMYGIPVTPKPDEVICSDPAPVGMQPFIISLVQVSLGLGSYIRPEARADRPRSFIPGMAAIISSNVPSPEMQLFASGCKLDSLYSGKVLGFRPAKLHDDWPDYRIGTSGWCTPSNQHNKTITYHIL